jgi:predicted acyltransferase
MADSDLGHKPLYSNPETESQGSLQFSAAEAPVAGDLPAVAEQPLADTIGGKSAVAPEHTSVKRLVSLDALRGLTIAFMIMVNNNGGPGAWSQMQHSLWNGLTATDLVFPTFLFVVGVSIVFAFEARLARGATPAQLTRHTFVRAGLLVLFGIVVNNFPFFHLEHMRFYGVLPRIGLCYLAVGLFYLWDRRVSTKLIALAVVLVGYWLLVRWVPVPGAGLPGRDIPFLDHNQNIVAWFDRHLMPGHLYEDWPLHNARDPEGLLSTIPAIGTTLIGLLTGIGLRRRRSTALKTAGLVAGAVACLSLGYFWSIWFPINKKMWTSSYTLVAAGWSLAAFAVFYWAIEQKGWFRQGRSKAVIWPWLVFGSNAITAYLISELLPGVLENIHFHWNGLRMNPIGWSQLRIFSQIPDPGWAAFAFCACYTLICFLPVWSLYRNKVFLKI